MRTIIDYFNTVKIVLCFVTLLFLPGPSGLFAQIDAFNDSEGSGDKTLSPYFFVQSDDPETDRLPLKSTSANVTIAGVIADVTIVQVYKNTGNNTLEAIYVFPASARAAVYGMKMTIGEREIIAIVQEKDQARKNYEMAKANGQTVSLLEQERPNVFTMNVANILPGDVIKVELSYTELLIPDAGTYEFVYPTVVGPRYQSGGENNTIENWVANPFLKEGERPQYTFDINIRLSTGIPIQSLQCRSHEVLIDFKNKTKAEIELKSTDASKGNKDFILQYRLAGNKIESGILLYEGEEENFFLAMIQPPKRVLQELIPPREYIFIVDVSGSMHGFPLDVSKQLMRNLISNLKPTDRFNVLLFAGGSSIFSERSVAAKGENISRAIAFVDKQAGGGGTELLPALKKAMALPGTEGFSRSFVIATDGYVSVEKQTFDFIDQNLGNANFFTFGIGSSVNRYLIEGMAHIGRGEPFIVTGENEAGAIAAKFRKYISSPVLTNIEIRFNGFDAYEVEPSSVPDVLAERPVILFGKWKGKTSGTIEVNGESGHGIFRKVIKIADADKDRDNSALKYLWVREKIRLLDDYSQVSYGDVKLKKQITDLGMKYNLLTQFTSFIALDSEIRNLSGNYTTVKQPLPLPEGVSNYAVGAPSASGIRMKHAVKGRWSRTEAQAEELDMVDFEIQAKPVTIDLPEFTGHDEGLQAFFKLHMKMFNARGHVFLSFVVDADGTIKEIKILNGLDTEANKEAIRLIKLTNGMWKVGREDGKNTAMEMMVAVKFG